MMTTAVQQQSSFISHINPKLSSYSFRIQSQAHNIPRRRCISIPPTPKGLGRIRTGTPFLYPDHHHHQHRGSKNNNILVSLSASNQEEKQPNEIDAEKEKNEVKDGTEESGEARNINMLRSTRKRRRVGLKTSFEMQDISQEAYELYSKKAAVILKETSEKLKIQAEVSGLDFSRLAKDISVEGKEYLSTVAEKSPKKVKDIVETFATSSADDWKNADKVPHFFLDIKILTNNFQFSILFLRSLRMFFQGPSFSSFITAIISGCMVAFFIYKIVLDGKQKKGPA
ncbi:hypothetical protein MKX03_008853 [Papaver bracteatum]|nr:hypothetical protein MKX03_008853 [Papaver bracteatum]